MSLAVKIKEIRKGLNMTQEVFANTIGVSRAVIAQYETSKSTPPRETLQRIADAGKIDVNELTNIVSTVVNEPQGIYETNAKSIELGFTYVRYVPVKAQAGYISSIGNPIYERDIDQAPLPIRIKNPDSYIAFEISGDSMLPDICEGDIAVCKQLPLERGIILHKEQLFIVVLKDFGTESAIICKKLEEYNKETGDAKFVSLNPGYPTYNLNITNIAQLFYIKQIIHIQEL